MERCYWGAETAFKGASDFGKAVSSAFVGLVPDAAQELPGV